MEDERNLRGRIFQEGMGRVPTVGAAQRRLPIIYDHSMPKCVKGVRTGSDP